MSASLLTAGLGEVEEAGLADRQPHLMADGCFAFEKFQTSFHFAIAQSLFTHLPINAIQLCLVKIANVLECGGRLYATYFSCPEIHHMDKLEHRDGTITYGYRDPYHYHFSLFEYLVIGLPLMVNNIGPWGHPRSQHMLEFIRA